MKTRWIVLIAIIILVMIAVCIIFSYPGLSGHDPHTRADDLFNQGIQCESNEDYICAKKYYLQAIALYDHDSRYYFQLAHAQNKLGEYSGAIENYQKAKILNPSDPNILDELNEALHLQATQTAGSILPPGNSTGETTRLPTPSKTPIPEPEIVYSIFDEQFDIEGVTTVSQSPDDVVEYRISENESYSGRYSLLINWKKTYHHWASLILGFDQEISNSQKAEKGQMGVIDLTPPLDYALQMFVKGIKGNEGFTVKFQDQNLIFLQSLGNQAVYHYDGIVDGRLGLIGTKWREYCLPLAEFDVDYWIKDKYRNWTEQDKQFNWSSVKQINIDADFNNTSGAIYIDAMRIIRASDCRP